MAARAALALRGVRCAEGWLGAAVAGRDVSLFLAEVAAFDDARALLTRLCLDALDAADALAPGGVAAVEVVRISVLEGAGRLCHFQLDSAGREWTQRALRACQSLLAGAAQPPAVDAAAGAADDEAASAEATSAPADDDGGAAAQLARARDALYARPSRR